MQALLGFMTSPCGCLARRSALAAGQGQRSAICGGALVRCNARPTECTADKPDLDGTACQEAKIVTNETFFVTFFDLDWSGLIRRAGGCRRAVEGR
jgi:hypothetical protein